MNTINRSLLLQAAAALAVLAPVAGYADNEIEEITVTATRRSESAQNVPISLSALTAADLSSAGITSTTGLGEQTPGLVMTQQAGALTPFIRGVGSLDGSAGAENSVSTYIDGVYLSAPYGNIFALNNIDRVEVLKGPQGTLFGRNATGGIVQVVTKNPSADTDAYGAVSYGNFETSTETFYGTIGVAPHLAADIAVVNINQAKGYGHNFPTGADVNQTKQTLVRSEWLFTPTGDTSVLAWFSYMDYRTSVGDSKQFLPGVRGLDGVTTYTGNWQNSTGGVNPEIDGIGKIAALQIDHDFGPVSLKSITSYQHLDVLQNFDNDLTPVPIIDVNINNQEYRTITQELQLLSNKDSKIKWIVGGYFMHDLAGFGGPIGLGLFGSAFGGGGVGLHNLITTKSFAGFGEVTLPIVEATNLTLGARYTKDERVLNGSTLILNDIASQTVVAKFPVTPAPHADFSKPTFRGILDHRFNEEIMVYGGFSRGFKSGNFNNVSPTDPPYHPEVLDSIEIGAKTDFFDRHLRLNASAFHYKYKDIQVGVSNGPTIITTNAASATVKGVDLDGRAVFNEYFDVGFGAEYLHAVINTFRNAPFLYPNPNGIGDFQVVGDASGNTLPRSPKYTLNVAPNYTVPVPGGKLKAGAALYYNDGFFWDFTNTRKQTAYAVVNASIGWQAASDLWGFRFFGSNLTNRQYAVFLVAQQPGDDFNAAPPRTFGIEFNFSLKPKPH